MGCITDGFNIPGSDTFLNIHQPGTCRMILSQKIGHQRVHSGGGEKNRGIVLGNKRFPGYFSVASGREKLYVLMSQFIGSHGGILSAERLLFKKPRRNLQLYLTAEITF
jgi:hypothetical protein